MIINGGSRKNGGFFAKHLMRADQNERVHVREIRGLGAENVPDAFREMKAIASGTRCQNYFYHANLNTRPDEVLTPEQWAEAVDSLERGLNLTGQPRFIVEHEKDGRTHQHVVWSRIDADSMTAISDSHNYRTHELVAAELETSFGHQATQRALTRDKETTPRPEPNVQDWESFRAAESKIDPKAMKAELTELWQHADSGQAFAAALEERGYILVRGDRRDLCVIDAVGDEHSLGRRISGVKAAEIRARMAEVDRDALPSVEEGRELARQRQDTTTEGSAAPVDAFAAVMAETAQKTAPAVPDAFQAVQPAEEPAMPAAAPADAFAAILAERTQEAAEDHAQAAQEEPASGGGRWQRFQAWCGMMREHLAGWGQQAQEYYRGWFGRREEPEPQPAPEQPTHGAAGPGMEPQL